MEGDGALSVATGIRSFTGAWEEPWTQVPPQYMKPNFGVRIPALDATARRSVPIFLRRPRRSCDSLSAPATSTTMLMWCVSMAFVRASVEEMAP